MKTPNLQESWAPLRRATLLELGGRGTQAALAEGVRWRPEAGATPLRRGAWVGEGRLRAP